MSGKGELETEFSNIIELLRGKKMGIPVKKVVKKVSVGGKVDDDDEKNNDVKKYEKNIVSNTIKVEEKPKDDPKVVVNSNNDPKLPPAENPRKIIDINGFKEKLKGKLHEIIASESKRKAEEEEQKQLNKELERKQQELLDEQQKIAKEQAEWNSRLTAIQNLIVSNSGKVDNALTQHKATIDKILKKVGETADKTTLRTEIDGLKNDLTEEVRKLNDAEKERHNGTVAEINNLKATMQGNMDAETKLYMDVATEVLKLSGTVQALEDHMNTNNTNMILRLDDQVVRIDELYKKMNTANYNIGVISKTLINQISEIRKLKTAIDDNKKSEEEERNAIEKSIKNVKNEADKALTNALKEAQSEYQKSIDAINNKLANLKSPDCCDELKNQMIEMNAKIDKMQEEQNRIKLNGFKDKIKGFLEKIKLSASISTGKSTETSTASTASIGTDIGPDLGSEKLVSSI